MNPLVPMEVWWLAVVVVLTAGGVLAWRSSAKASTPVRGGILAARLLGLAGLALIALNPGHWVSRTRVETAEWALLVDRSASMQTPDVEGRSRWAAAGRLADQAAAAARKPGRLRCFSLAAELEEAGSVGELLRRAPDGPRTELERAARALLGRYQAGGRLAGVILISDGRETAAARSDEAWLRARAQDVPFHVIPLGGVVERPDLILSVPQRHLVGYTGQTTRITAQVRNQRLGNIRPTVQLLDGRNRSLARQSVELADNSVAALTFEVVPDQAGYVEYRLAADVWPGEVLSANNTARIGLTVLAQKIRVFLAEGAPFWDSKFLAQLLRERAGFDLTSLYRVSAERFFQIASAGTNESAGVEFPDDLQRLSAFDVVLFGKGAEYFLTPARSELLQRYVRDHGGRVVFARGKPYAGQQPGLEPLEPVVWGAGLSEEFECRPRPDARAAGLFGDMLPAPDDPVWSQLPLLRNACECQSVKTFAEVHADGVVRAGHSAFTVPLVISRRYGRGLTVTINAEGFWQWDFIPQKQETRKLYAEWWRQLLNWTVAYAEFLPGQRYALSLSAAALDAGQPVRARVLSRAGAPPPAGGAPVVELWRDGALIRSVTATPAGAAEQGAWEALFTVEDSGLYRVALRGAPDVSAPLQVLAPPGEADNTSAAPERLKEIAALTGGRVLRAADLPAVVATLEGGAEHQDLGKALWSPAWDRVWVALWLTACFAAEWFLRRRNGLL